MGAALTPPMTVTRVRSREPVIFELAEGHQYLPCESYPCKGGLVLLSQYYRPNLPVLTRHKEYSPEDEHAGHTILTSGIVRRESCVGTLFERHRALEKVFHQVMQENTTLSDP